MKLRQTQSAGLKTKLSSTLRSWLPILQSGLEELEDQLRAYEEENPCMEVRSGFEEQFSAKFGKHVLHSRERSGSAEAIEALTIHEKSLYERLYEQIGAPLFPTPRSEAIAFAIIEEISAEGYFEGSVASIARRLAVSPQEVEKIRQRFAYLSPSGVGARDTAEAMLFQLRQSEVTEPLYSLVARMLEDFENLARFKENPLYSEAIGVIRRFKNPPAIETMEASPPAIPDLIIVRNDENIEVKINDDFYPDILVHGGDLDHRFLRKKMKEARDLFDALQMRKATLYKIGLMIVEFQYDFFRGGDIRPMKLKDIAEEFDHNPSTISRAIANKYLMCDRGIFPMKAFFTAGLDEDVSNASIKRFIAETIASEDRDKPLSDQKLLELIEEKFGVKMVRRTVTKYRKQMKIGGSSERKRFYRLA
ncbi:RNA polymerase factor sigma-54 [Hydrogenimonas urashimensis]|uniref:RNA polymerase factor sigma-54 n=1 Tax=Hydrogenimonas urashimensis TaxID=2740515 RepID=UPI0019165F6C|nr:RNA polymerase factor sigma-54 [Hydrogenimonas urashimensis]